jgi:hypothetical protein
MRGGDVIIMSSRLVLLTANSLRAVRLSQLVSRKGLGEGRMGEWKFTGNLSGVTGDAGEKRRCLLSTWGGVDIW